VYGSDLLGSIPGISGVGRNSRGNSSACLTVIMGRMHKGAETPPPV